MCLLEDYWPEGNFMAPDIFATVSKRPANSQRDGFVCASRRLDLAKHYFQCNPVLRRLGERGLAKSPY
jgi:hypothetical protein